MRRTAAFLLPAAILAATGIALLEAAAGRGARAAVPGVTDRACLECHESAGLSGAPHEVLLSSMPGVACEACHGPAAEHAADPAGHPMLRGVEPAKVAGLCRTCHVTGPEHVTGWETSEFAMAGQSCPDCHAIHPASENRLEWPADEAGNLGDGACRMCHRPVFEGMERSFHAAVLGKPGGGCEACHGPGRAHAEGAVDLARGRGDAHIAAEPPATACLLCHRAIPDRHARDMPVYREKRPACTVCHDVHVNKDDPIWADLGEAGALAGKRAGSESCAKCHLSSVKSFGESVHAGLAQGDKGGCEACHGPALAHVRSGGRARFVKDPLRFEPEAASAICLACHGDAPDHARDWKGGPLASQRLSCLTCHVAHGTAAEQGHPLMPEGVVAKEGKYVGSGTCAVCHSDAHPGILESPHAPLLRDPDAAGCESCHGPGSAHVMRGGAREAIRNPGNLPEGRKSEFCLSCHGADPGRVKWTRGEHRKAGLACTTCHDPLRSSAKSARKKDPALCASCHGEVAAEFRLPFHHPLDRGAVGCTSCHDPHGEVAGHLSLAARKDRCTKCHASKRGPFLYEHEADRTDGCVVCHRPHGAANRRLLTHTNVRDLCIQCHVTPASHNQAAGSPFLNCLSCHGSIHGSYVDEKFFR